MSSQNSRAPQCFETGFAKTYQVLPSASVMADELDNILAARQHLEQSLASDKPTFTSETLNTMYESASVIRLKRTARALAAQTISADDENNFITSDKLPAIASPLVLSVGTSQTKLQALPVMAAPVRRRNLLPAPKTNMLPISSPTELRGIIRESHSKRQEQIKARKTRQGLSSSRTNQQAKNGGLWRKVKEVFAQPMRQLSHLLDQLALA